MYVVTICLIFEVKLNIKSGISFTPITRFNFVRRGEEEIGNKFLMKKTDQIYSIHKHKT